MIWTTGHEEWGPRFVVAAIVCLSLALTVLVYPLLRRPPHIAAVGIVLSFLCLVGFSVWYYLDQRTVVINAAKHGVPSSSTPLIAPSASSAASPVAALGSLRYVLFIAEIQHQARTGQTAVQMMVEVENTNDFLVKFDAQLHGEVSGVRPPNYELPLVGFVAAHSKTKLIYNRIDNVPVNSKVAIGQPVLTGRMDYIVTYWAASDPSSIKRITARTVEFEHRVPLASKPFKKPGTVEMAGYEITTHFSNEREE